MMQQRKKRRVIPKRIADPSGKPIHVVAQGYGDIAFKKWRIGKLLRRSKHTFDVEFKDEEIEGSFVWRFSVHSGKRICDIGNDSGWVVSPSELSSTIAPPISGKRGSGLSKVHEEIKEVSDKETITYQMWVYKGPDGLQQFYLKAFRTVVVKEERDRYGRLAGAVKVREHAAVIPIEKVQEILFQFKETANV